MEKFSLKSLLIIVVVLLIGITALWQIQRRARPAVAWFNDAWQYRKAITLTNSGTGQTDVYIALTIGTSDTTRFQADAGDIRFTKQNGELLPYYIVSGAGTSSTLIHINFDIYPAGASTFYLYYGNSSADNGFSTSNFTTAASNSSTNLLTEELSPAPIAYWNFDEGVGTTVYDSSSNKRNGVLATGSSAPAWVSEDQCVVGKCLSFNGSTTYIDSNFDFSYGYDDSATISVWIKPNSIDTGSKTKVIIGKNAAEYFITQYNDKIQLIHWNTVGSDAINIQSNAGSIQANKWQYITYVYDGTAHKAYLYINGIYHKQATPAYTDFSNAAESVKIGKGYGWGGSTTPFFNGFIDEPKIYAYARTATQIKQDYKAGLSGMKSQKGVNVAAGGQSAKSLSDGLVGYWKMDEGVGTTTADSSGNNNTGTLSGAGWGSGKFGIGTSYGGTNNVMTVPDTNNTLDLPNDFTIAFWVNPTSSGTKELIGKPNQGNYEFWQSSTNLSIRINGGTPIMDATSIFTYGQWTHVTVKYERSSGVVTVYQNGNYFTKGSNTNAASINDSPVQIGGFTNGTSYPFQGLLDEVRIYNRALSPDEVRQLAEYAPGPIAYYNFEEGVGTTLYDRSGNSNNAIWSTSSYSIGKIGKAGNFTTSNYATIGTTNSIDIMGPITISAYVKPTLFNSENIIVSRGGGSSGNLQYLLTIESNIPRFYIGNTSDLKYASGSTISLNNWYYLTGIFDGTKTYIYVNSIGTSGGTITNQVHNTSYAPRIGAYSHAGTYQFTGLIDEVKIYNYARTQKQIIQDMNASNPMSQKTPILWLKLNEGVGRTIVNFGSLGSVINGYTIGNTTPTWVMGKEGKALSFDGLNAHFNVYNHNDLKITGQDKTISVWFNHSSTDDGGYILSKPWHGMGGYNWGITAQSNSRINFSIGASTSWSVSPTQTYQKDVWNHLAISIANPNVKIFLNGKKISDTNHTITNWSPNGGDSNVRLAVGCLYPYDASTCNSTPSAFGGYLDEVKIYNTALSDAEIKLDYNQGAQFVMGKTNQTIGGTTTSLEYCIPGDTSHCAPPIAEYKFDEGIGTSAFDTSGNNNNGRLINSPQWIIGKIGKGISFVKESGQYIQIDPTKESNFDFTTEVTMEAWVNLSSHDSFAGIISKTASNTNGWEIRTTSTNGNIQCRVLNGSDVGATATISLNEWHHLSCAYSTTDNLIKLFIDGKNESTREASNGIATNDNAVLINALAYSGSLNTTGLIDQVRIYNYARTPAQIAYDYNKGAPVGWWKFDECEGTMINDWSGIGNTGTLVIGAGGSQVSVGTCSIGNTSAWSNGATGKINSAMSFDGTDDYVSINSFNITPTAYSISLWAKRNTISNYGVLIGMTANYKNALWAYENGNIGFGYANGLWRSWSSIWNDKTNYHNIIVVVPVTGASSTATLYFDGINKGNITVDTSGVLNNIKIGQFETLNNGTYFNGFIDDVRIYNYALTAEQVKQIYNGGAVNFR